MPHKKVTKMYVLSSFSSSLTMATCMTANCEIQGTELAVGLSFNLAEVCNLPAAQQPDPRLARVLADCGSQADFRQRSKEDP